MLVPCVAQAQGGYPGSGYSGPLYIGGTVVNTSTGSHGSTTQTTNYSYDNNSVYGGSYYASSGSDAQGDPPTSGTVTCSGNITATFTWNNGGDPNNTPPKCIVITEHCVASWTGQASGGATVTGHCTNPLGGSSVASTPGPGATWDYTRYTVQNNPPATLTLSCSPSADAESAGASAPNSSSVGSANVRYTASVTPVAINLAGTTPDSSGNLSILVGQGCTASLVGIPSNCTVSNYNWTVPGVTFQSWTASPSSAVRDPIAGQPGYGSPTQPTVHWFWSDAAASETVTCTATVTPPLNMGSPFSVTVTQTVSLRTPSISENDTSGLVRLDNGASSTYNSPYALFLGPQAGTTGRGITWTAKVDTPSPFSGQGPGTWQFAQIITPTASRTPPGGTAQASSNNGLSGCDGAYPYGGGAYFADNSSHNSGDSPGFGIQDAYTNYQVTQTFKTYIMYQPPPAAQANGVMWVPLWEIDWNWTATATQTGGSWANWPVGKSPGSLTITSSKAQQTTHPIWSRQVTPPAIW